MDGEFEYDIYSDVSNYLEGEYGYGVMSQITEEQYYSIVLELLYNMYESSYIITTQDSRQLYVQGNDVFSFNYETRQLINTSSHYSATLVNSNKISDGMEAYLLEEVTATEVADLAVIRTEQPINLPSIPVQYQGLLTGQQIYVIGYPGLVDNEEFTDISTIYSSTVTQGTISAIKPNSNNTFDLLQIDASVEHGNSGGPIVSDEGTVVGIATYGLASSGSGNYNAGVGSKAISEFLTQSGVITSTNEERDLLSMALVDISNSYYSKAEEKLQSLVDNQDSLGVTINPFIELCQSKIAAGEDKNPIFDLSNWQTIIIPLMVLILIVMGIILIMLVKRGKNNKKDVTTKTVETPQVPTQTQV